MDDLGPGDGRPEKPFVLIAVGYFMFAIAAIYLGEYYQTWRAKKKRAAEGRQDD